MTLKQFKAKDRLQRIRHAQSNLSKKRKFRINEDQLLNDSESSSEVIDEAENIL